MKKRCRIIFLWLLLFSLTACSGQSRWQKQYDLGMQYLTEGNYEEAIVAFNAAIEIEPKEARAYVGRGSAYIKSGETEENLAAALADYQKAVELDAQNSEAYLGIADVYIRQGDYDMALEILNEGLEKTGKNEMIADKISEIESGNIMDSSGKTRRRSGYNATGTIIWYHELAYNPDGSTASITAYDGSDNQIGHVDLAYDEDGKATVSYWYTDSGEVGKLTYEYDTAGNIVREEEYDKNGSLWSILICSYDSSGNCIQRENYSADGELQATYSMEYNEQGWIVRQSHYGSDGQLYGYDLFKYNANGERTETESYNADGQLTRLEISLYDEEGNYAGYEVYDGEGNLEQTVTYGG